MSSYSLRRRKRPTECKEEHKEFRIKKVKKDKSTKDSTSKLKTKVVDLNDDCLDTIFSYLSYQDILSVSKVCVLFQDRARAVFKRKKYNLEVFCVKTNESKQLIRHIGPALLKIEIFFCDDMVSNQRTVDLITKYCPSLSEITLHCLTKRTKLHKPFNQVTKLTLSFCDFIGRFKLTKWFPNLTSLTYHHTKDLKKFIKQNVPMMDTLNINYFTTHTDTTTMLLSNPQIKHLSLNFVSRGGVTIQRDLFTAIDKALPGLQTLNLIFDRPFNIKVEYQPLHFKHLKVLRIENYTDFSNCALIDHLAISTESLELLQLRFSDTANDSQSYTCITKYTNVRKLQVMPVHRSLGVDVILMLINKLPLLEQIEQTADFTNIVPWTADEIQNFIRNAKQFLRLDFVFVYEAKSKFNRTLNFIQTQFMGSEWMVNTEKRFSPKVFNTDGMDGQMQKQLVISISKITST